MNALAAFSGEMFDALRRIGDRPVTAHEIGVNGFTLKSLARRGFLLADEGKPTIYAITPMGKGAVAVLTAPPSPKETEGDVARIQRLVAQHYRIALIEMTSARREQPIARARQVGMYLARELTPMSYPAIGRLFGKRDHTTVIHGVRLIERLMVEDAEFAAAVNKLREECK